MIRILAFGIAKEILGGSSVQLEWPQEGSVAELKSILEKKYPALLKIGTYMLAVNTDYAQDDALVAVADEVAIIPPVSGG
jgi:molybdopterin synthase sulfur carrier subunit